LQNDTTFTYIDRFVYSSSLQSSLWQWLMLH